MKELSKSLLFTTLFTTFLLTLGLLICNSVWATPPSYPYPPPAVPDFIVTCTNNDLNVIITNQPFTPFVGTVIIQNANVSQPVSLYYNVQVKGHSDDNWTDIYSWGPDYPTQSKSNYTVFMYSLGKGPIFGNLSYSSQVYIQVQAMVGHWNYQQVFPPINPHFPFPYEWTFYGTFGNWSQTQTINLENGATSTSLPSPATTSTPFSSPTVPEFPWIAIPLLLSLLSVAAILIQKKPKNML
jgi:hypothetical protein